MKARNFAPLLFLLLVHQPAIVRAQDEGSDPSVASQIFDAIDLSCDMTDAEMSKAFKKAMKSIRKGAHLINKGVKNQLIDLNEMPALLEEFKSSCGDGPDDTTGDDSEA